MDPLILLVGGAFVVGIMIGIVLGVELVKPQGPKQ